MIDQWFPSDPAAASKRKRVSNICKPTQPKAKEDDPTCRKGTKYAEALILTAHGSCNAATGRYDIQGKCIFPDGTNKKVGILGFSCQEPFGTKVWENLMSKTNEAKGKITKGDIVNLRDELIASFKSGHQCPSFFFC